MIERLLRFLMVKVVGQHRVKKILLALANLADLNLLQVAYNNIGILNYRNAVESGEQFFISSVLKKYLSALPRPVIFDVGANIGKYSLMLSETFPGAKIYSFEPNINTFSLLTQKLNGKAECFNIGIGSDESTGRIYTYSDNAISEHASVFKDVFTTFHRADDLVAIDFKMDTLDKFCERRDIHQVDFLKIDTEGNELNVLKGASRMLSEKKLKIIQFEFGECNVFSRVFLRDFYDLLPDYRIYRLNRDNMIPLFQYVSTNEIFRFQNLVAIHESLEDYHF